MDLLGTFTWYIFFFKVFKNKFKLQTTHTKNLWNISWAGFSRNVTRMILLSVSYIAFHRHRTLSFLCILHFHGPLWTLDSWVKTKRYNLLTSSLFGDFLPLLPVIVLHIVLHNGSLLSKWRNWVYILVLVIYLPLTSFKLLDLKTLREKYILFSIMHTHTKFISIC